MGQLYEYFCLRLYYNDNNMVLRMFSNLRRSVQNLNQLEVVFWFDKAISCMSCHRLKSKIMLESSYLTCKYSIRYCSNIFDIVLQDERQRRKPLCTPICMTPFSPNALTELMQVSEFETLMALALHFVSESDKDMRSIWIIFMWQRFLCRLEPDRLLLPGSTGDICSILQIAKSGSAWLLEKWMDGRVWANTIETSVAIFR